MHRILLCLAVLLIAAPCGAAETGRPNVLFIDIYPSLCELAGLAQPDHLQGRSFVPLMNNPDWEWKPAAIGRFRNGDTIRTDRYRFTQYTNSGGKPVARMLYDHQVDPQEDVNIARRAENRKEVQRLRKQLHERMGKDGLFSQ